MACFHCVELPEASFLQRENKENIKWFEQKEATMPWLKLFDKENKSLIHDFGESPITQKGNITQPTVRLQNILPSETWGVFNHMVTYKQTECAMTKLLGVCTHFCEVLLLKCVGIKNIMSSFHAAWKFICASWFNASLKFCDAKMMQAAENRVSDLLERQKKQNKTESPSKIFFCENLETWNMKLLPVSG